MHLCPVLLPANQLYFLTALLALLSLPLCLCAQNNETRAEISSSHTEAESLEKRNQFYDAIEIWQRVLRENPNSSSAYFGIARNYMHLNRYKEALRFIEKAHLLRNQDYQIGILKSRILMGLKRYGEARELLLKLKEGNTSYQIDMVLAEVFAILGDIESSIHYLDSIKEFARNDLNFHLISLMVYEEAEKIDIANNYLQQVLESHYNEAVVHKVAAGYYLRHGRYNEVLEQIDIIKRLDIDTEELRLLGLEAAYLKGDYQLAINLAETLVTLYPQNAQAWYIMGLAYSGTNRMNAAIKSLNTARRINPDDELVKIVIAEMLRTLYPYPSEWHTQEAARYIASAKAKRKNLLYDEALQDYRFALQIDPLNKENWMAFANVFRDRGNYAKYLDKLYAWKRFGVSANPKGQNRDIQRDMQKGSDAIERQSLEPELDQLIRIYEASLPQSVAAKWDIDQYNYSNNYHPLQVFVINGNNFAYNVATRELGSYFVNILQWYPKPYVLGDVQLVDDSLQAQQAAYKNRNSDYYIILDFTRQRDGFHSEVRLYLSSTGRQIAAYNVEKVSKGNIYNSFAYLARQLQAIFPQKARIIETKVNQAVISQGRLDGVQEGQKWVILPESALSASVEKPFGEYEENQVIGTFTVEATDEKLSEGQVQLRSFVNPAKPDDIALRLPIDPSANSQPEAEDEAATPKEEPLPNQPKNRLLQEPNLDLQDRLFELF